MNEQQKWCYNFDPAVSRQPKFGISNALVVYNSTVNVEADRTRKQPIASAHFCGVRKIAAKSKRKNRLAFARDSHETPAGVPFETSVFASYSSGTCVSANLAESRALADFDYMDGVLSERLWVNA